MPESSELPGPAEPTATTTIGDGLYAETFQPSGAPRGSVIITHGYADHSGRYRELAHVIKNAGWAVLSWDVRGHGKSPGARGYIDRFSRYLDDYALACTAARALAPGKPFVMVGHSHGSLIALRALCGDRPPEATAAILSSPFLGLRLAVPKVKILAGKIASVIAPRFAQKNELRPEDLTHDKQKQAERVADKLCFDIATARWFTEASKAQAYCYDHADRIKVPTTWLVGADDPIADPAQSKRVAARAPKSTYHDLVGMRHEVFNEVDRAKVFALVTGVLAASA